MEAYVITFSCNDNVRFNYACLFVLLSFGGGSGSMALPVDFQFAGICGFRNEQILYFNKSIVLGYIAIISL